MGHELDLNLVVSLWGYAVESSFLFFSFLRLGLEEPNLLKVDFFKTFPDFLNGLRAFPTLGIKQNKDLNLTILEVDPIGQERRQNITVLESLKEDALELIESIQKVVMGLLFFLKGQKVVNNFIMQLD